MGLSIPIVAEYDGKAVDKAIKQFGQLEGASAKTAFALKKAALPAAAAIGGIGIALFDATKSAMEDEAAQVQLALALQNVTGASDAQIASSEKFITQMSLASGVADDELRPALASLVRGTKDVETAQSALTLAQDIATGSNKSLAEVSDALAKAYGGNMKGLQALSPEIKAMIKDGASLDDVMNVLGGTFGGASDAAAATAEGGMKRLGIAVSETKESIGAALIPIVEAALPVLIKFGSWAQENTKTLLIIIGVIGGVSAAVLLFNTVVGIATLVNTVFALSLTAAQLAMVGFATLGIGLVIAALVALYFKFDIVRKVVDTVIDGIVTGTKFAFDVLKNYFTAVLGIYKSIFNGIASLWNNTIGKLSFEFPSWVPGLGGRGFSVPNIPYLAEGGIVTGPTLAMIGENGPEAVLPLNGKNGGMGGGVTINITGGISSSADIGRSVVDALTQYSQVYGPLNLAIR
ncbi:hypothetical protein OAC42_02215 [Flavobacteriaceae bacterium]|nr:hypothetical protein [Flavobacteriaceae bacterium]